MLGAEWQKARETFISYKAIANEARAERDAATAAIERVRAVLSAWEMVQARNREYLESGNPGMIVPIDCTGGLRVALDGAPEPEWEYQCTNSINTTGLVADPELHARQCSGKIERRRKPGPWVPVESEGE